MFIEHRLPAKTVSTLIHERVELAKQGLSSQVICRLRSGWAVLGDSQFIAGYSLLLPEPVVPSLNDLGPGQRSQFLLDMTAIGDALLATTMLTGLTMKSSEIVNQRCTRIFFPAG